MTRNESHHDTVGDARGDRERGSDAGTGAASRRQFLRSGAGALAGGLALTTGALGDVRGPAGSARAAIPSNPENFHLYLLFGQSNMEGQGEIAPKDRETNPRVQVLADKTCSNLNREYGNWYVAEPPLNRCWGNLGPGDYFGKTMAQESPDDVTIGLVPAAVSGADIALFEKGAPIGRNGRSIPSRFAGGYEWMLDLARIAQEDGVFKGICFHQGETNTAETQWKYTVQSIVRNLRSDLGTGAIPFLAGELLYEEFGGCCGIHNEQINQLPGLIENAHVVSAAGLEGQDNAHFTAAAYRELGRRYAREMLKHVTFGDPGCPGVATDPDADGLCEDLNGNGEFDADDVVELFQNIETYDDPGPIDFNGNGNADFDDVVTLFQQL